MEQRDDEAWETWAWMAGPRYAIIKRSFRRILEECSSRQRVQIRKSTPLETESLISCIASLQAELEWWKSSAAAAEGSKDRLQSELEEAQSTVRILKAETQRMEERMKEQIRERSRRCFMIAHYYRRRAIRSYESISQISTVLETAKTTTPSIYPPPMMTVE